MKKNTILSLVLAGVVAALTACSTFESPDQVTQMVAASKVAAYTATAIYLSDHPDDRAKFESATNSLNLLLANQEFDPIALHQVLLTLPIDELDDPKAHIAIGSAMILWETYGSGVTNLDGLTRVAPVIGGIRDGISRGLAVIPTP